MIIDVTALDADQLNALTESQLGALTSEQIGALAKIEAPRSAAAINGCHAVQGLRATTGGSNFGSSR